MAQQETKRTKAGWDRERERSAETQSAKSRAGRDIAGDDFPGVADPGRKARAAESLDYFCRTYMGQTFSMPWSEDHLRAIARIETAVRVGGLFAYAMPRGSGKTSLAEAAALWAQLYGYRQFVVLIGSDESSALELLESIKTELETNDLLLADFPEVCHPIRCLEGIAHRANGQLFDGARTHIVWTAKEIVLPTIPGSKASGAVIATTGITGRIRGMKFKRPGDGRAVRPDLVIPDDPQTDDSAKSPSQCAERVRILCGAVLGLAGPGKKIAVVMPCTVIRPGDMADEMLDRARHPEWQGERTKLVYDWPTNEELWEQYRKVRSDSLRAGHGGREATEFYAAHRAAMDAGARVAWPERKNPDELSALQHAVNLRQDLGDAAFMAEYQNDPLPEDAGDDEALTADQIKAKANGLKRGLVPSACSRLTAFIDVHKEVLYWAVCAWEDDFSGHLVEYGTYPDQRLDYFQLREARHTLGRLVAKRHPGAPGGGMEAAIRLGLDDLAERLLGREWPRDGDGAPLRVERCLVDANWGDSSATVDAFCRESPHAAVLTPSHGKGVTAGQLPFGDYHRRPGDRVGPNWRVPVKKGSRPVRHCVFDANFWKTFVHLRLAVPKGGRGSLTLFGRPEDHRLLADHLTAEQGVRTEGRGRKVTEWKQRPGVDNHFFDDLVGCCVAASMLGVKLDEATAKGPVKTGKRLKLSEIQKQKAGQPQHGRH